MAHLPVFCFTLNPYQLPSDKPWLVLPCTWTAWPSAMHSWETPTRTSGALSWHDSLLSDVLPHLILAASGSQSSDYCFLNSEGPQWSLWLPSLCTMSHGSQVESKGMSSPCECSSLNDHDLVMPGTCCWKTVASYFMIFCSYLWLEDILHHRELPIVIYVYLSNKYLLSIYSVCGIRNTWLNKWHDLCPHEVYKLWEKRTLNK